MENDLRERLERFKIKAEEFLANNIKAFIVDTNDTYYFCDIILVSDTTLLIQDMRTNQQHKLYWADIVKFDEYKDREVVDGSRREDT